MYLSFHHLIFLRKILEVCSEYLLRLLDELVNFQHMYGIGATADEQEAVLSRFNAKAASNGFEEAMVDDDWGVFCIVDPVPIDAFCVNDSVIRYSELT